MKRLSLFIISVFILLSISTYGENTYTGKIVWRGNPCTTDPCLPCAVLWLETSFGNYVLSINSHWICNSKIIFDGIEYFIDDEVEVTGTISVGIDISSEEYFNLEIETIKKLTSNIESVSFSNNKVYYDVTKQVIVIDETLQNQSLTFELVDMQGQAVLRKTSIDNSTFISVANLPSGVYLYRLVQDSQIIGLGKILKTNKH